MTMSREEVLAALADVPDCEEVTAVVLVRPKGGVSVIAANGEDAKVAHEQLKKLADTALPEPEADPTADLSQQELGMLVESVTQEPWMKPVMDALARKSAAGHGEGLGEGH